MYLVTTLPILYVVLNIYFIPAVVKRLGLIENVTLQKICSKKNPLIYNCNVPILMYRSYVIKLFKLNK